MYRTMSALVLVALAAFGVASTPTPLPSASQPSIQPLTPIGVDASAVVTDTPVVGAPGARHFEGQFHLIASGAFNTGSMKTIDSSVELISDTPIEPGKRHVFARVPEPNLDVMIEALRADPSVVAVSKNAAFEASAWPNDPLWPGQLGDGTRFLDLPPAWFVTRGMSTVRVAVIDGGVTTNSDLAGRLDPGVNVISPFDGTGDLVGHGTKIATLIAGGLDNGRGPSGVAPNVRIVPVVACPPNAIAGEICPGTYVFNGLTWILSEIRNGRPIDVVNMSFGTDQEDAVDEVLGWLKDLGVIAVAAAGNDGDTTHPGLDFPADSDNVITVGGIAPNGSRDPRSSYGPELDTMAPFTTWSLDNTDSQVEISGTSFSAPYIAGLAALFKSVQPIMDFGRPTGLNDLDYFLYTLESYPYDHAHHDDTGFGFPDAFVVLWSNACVRYDLNHDGRIDILDAQAMAFRYGAIIGQLPYEARFDLRPYLRDYMISINDLQSVFGKMSSHCPG